MASEECFNPNGNQLSPVNSLPANRRPASQGCIPKFTDRASEGEERSRLSRLHLGDPPPMNKIEDIFAHLCGTAWELGFGNVVYELAGRPITIGTLCSGTESPILALQEIQDTIENVVGLRLSFHHAFSAEIEPVKQAYIERNFAPPILFRDVVEMANTESGFAHTAYAGLERVPEQVDILIAGASCVDFSNLNTKRNSDLNSKGESADTFQAAVKLVARMRPLMVIFENVLNAPWKDLCAVMQNDRQNQVASQFCKKVWSMNDPAYTAVAMTVDTKNYYLPQTRSRGYMLCVDNDALQGEHEVTRKFATLMQDLQCRVTSPLEAFLLPSDDVRIQKIKRFGVTKNRRGVRTEWSKCRASHDIFRLENQLGYARPFTKWVEGGSARLMDYMWESWMSPQGNRTHDCIDIAHLQAARGGFDSMSKSQVWDISQSPNRRLGNPNFGVSGCLTPNGLPFATQRGGPITGLESLSLQGIPIERLILKGESNKTLQDLAGNAMSCTVIGAAIISALTAGSELLLERLKAREPLLERSYPLNSIGIQTSSMQILHSSDLQDAQSISAKEFVELGLQSRLLCYCETTSWVTDEQLQQCEDCGHTACKKCGRNPRHRFSHISSAGRCRGKFDSAVKRALPLALTLAPSEDLSLDIESLFAECQYLGAIANWKDYKKLVRRAFTDDYFFVGTKCSSAMVVNYEGKSSRLTLTIGKGYPQWRLFAEVGIDAQWNEEIRQLIKLPIARMIVTDEDDLLGGAWQVCLPFEISLTVNITGYGKLINSWESSIGLRNLPDEKSLIWDHFDVQHNEPTTSVGLDVAGTYTALPHCGMPMRSLYKKHKVCTDETDMFLFLDPDPVGDIGKDCFVFSTNNERLNFNEKREISGYLTPGYRLSSVKESSTRYSSFGTWKICGNYLRPLDTNRSIQYSILNHNEIEQMAFDDTGPSDTSAKIANTYPPLGGPMTPGLHCSSLAMGLVECRLPRKAMELVSSLKVFKTSGEILNAETPSQQLDMLSKLGFVIEPLRDASTAQCSWKPLLIDPSHQQCAGCGPQHPSLRWKWRPTKFPKSKKAANDGKTDRGSKQQELERIVPTEDEIEAGVYERALKSRPPVFLMQTWQEAGNDCVLTLGINLSAMVHRLCRRIRSWHSATLALRIDTKDALGEGQTRTIPTLMSNMNGPQAEIELPTAHRLYPNQRSELFWMIQQENTNEPTFENQEIEEFVVPKLEWRIAVKASAWFNIRGGILADHVGFGKTVTSLALHYAQRAKAEAYSIEASKGSIAVKATLVVVPPHLTTQWSNEAKKFLGPKCRILLIKSHGKRYTVQDIQDADIVIVSSSFLTSEPSLQDLSVFAALPQSPQKHVRGFQVWVDQVMTRVEEHVNYCRERNPKWLADYLYKKLQSYRQELAASCAIPARRLRGIQYKNMSAQRSEEASISTHAVRRNAKSNETTTAGDLTAGVSENVAETALVPTSVGGPSESHSSYPDVVDDDAFNFLQHSHLANIERPPLQIFSFFRLVEDEISYSQEHLSIITRALKAECRWVLSGTLLLKSFEDVAAVSRHLGLELGAKENVVGFLKQKGAPQNNDEKTDFEAFHALTTENPSTFLQLEKSQLAQRFLNQFARQNSANTTNIAIEHKWLPVQFYLVEFLDYKTLQQQLSTQGFASLQRMHLRPKFESSQHMSQLLRESDGATEALLTRSSFPYRQLESGNEERPFATHARMSVEQLWEITQVDGKKVEAEIWDLVQKVVRLQKRSSHLDSHQTFFHNFCKYIAGGEFGDDGISILLLEMFATAEENLKEHPSAGDLYDMPLDVFEENHTENAATPTSNQEDRQIYVENAEDQAPQLASDQADFQSHQLGTEDAVISPTTNQEGDQMPEIETKQCENKKEDDLQFMTKELHRLILQLITAKREWLYAKKIVEIIGAQADPTSALQCNGCNRQHLWSELIILGACGHLACRSCLAHLDDNNDHCWMQGCNAYNPRQVRLDPKKLNNTYDNTQHRFGSKTDLVIKLLTEEIAADDQVILFVQTDSHVAKIATALTRLSIPHVAVDRKVSEVQSAGLFDRFKKSKADTVKVLILDGSDKVVTGSNLVNASHLIFLSPPNAKTQHEWNSRFKQAIGRACRHGQTKSVIVYHLFTLTSIDVDLYERWTQQKIFNDAENDCWNLAPVEKLSAEHRAQDWSGGFLEEDGEDEEEFVEGMRGSEENGA